MSTKFPATVDDATSLPYPTPTSPRNSPSLSTVINAQNDALIAIENKLGSGASTATSGKLLIGTGSNTSAWTKTAPTGAILGDSDSQTITNKAFGTGNTGIIKSVVAGANITVDTTDPLNPIIAGTSGTVSPLTTKGDLYTRSSSTNARLGVGSDGQILTADSTQTNGIKWAAGATQSVIMGEVPAGTPNGVLVTFTLASTPATNSLALHKNGIRLKAGGADYTLSGNTITFVTAPPTGAVLLADYNVSSTVFSVGTNSLISDETPAGTVNGSTVIFTASRAYIAGGLEVYINGVKQVRGQHFTETTPASGIFTMSTAPLTGDVISINYQFNLNPSSNADTVDGIHASSTPVANQLLALDGNATFPRTVVQTGVLGYAQVTSAVTSTSSTGAQLTGLTATVTIPSGITGSAGAPRIKVTVYSPNVSNSASSTNYGISVWDGAVISGTQITYGAYNNATGGATTQNMAFPTSISWISNAAVTAGSKTYNVGGFTSSGTLTVGCSTTGPAYILVEVV